jgi:hypothetical protein
MCTSGVGAVHAASDGWNSAAKGTQSSSYTALAYHFSKLITGCQPARNYYALRLSRTRPAALTSARPSALARNGRSQKAQRGLASRLNSFMHGQQSLLLSPCRCQLRTGTLLVDSRNSARIYCLRGADDWNAVKAPQGSANACPGAIPPALLPADRG